MKKNDHLLDPLARKKREKRRNLISAFITFVLVAVIIGGVLVYAN